MYKNLYPIETNKAEIGEQKVEMRASMKTRVNTWTFKDIWFYIFSWQCCLKARSFFIHFVKKRSTFLERSPEKHRLNIPSDQRTDIHESGHCRLSWNCRGPKIRLKLKSPSSFSPIGYSVVHFANILIEDLFSISLSQKV